MKAKDLYGIWNALEVYIWLALGVIALFRQDWQLAALFGVAFIISMERNGYKHKLDHAEYGPVVVNIKDFHPSHQRELVDTKNMAKGTSSLSKSCILEMNAKILKGRPLVIAVSKE